MNSDTLPLVLYGAGANAVGELANVKKKGLNPVCFCDSDSLKHGFEYLGLPVLSFKQVQDKYYDFNIYITPADFSIRSEIIGFLLAQGLYKEKIVNYEEYEEYSGCHFLESSLVIDHRLLTFCCKTNNMMSESPGVFWNNNNFDVEVSISKFIENRDRLIHLVKNNKSSECEGCVCIVNKLWVRKKRIDTVGIGFPSPCQLSCTYCGSIRAFKKVNDNNRRFINSFDWKRFVDTLEKKNLITDKTIFGFASGELSINPRIDEILNSLAKYGISVLTNGIVYNEKIAKLTTMTGGGINISVDAGTRKTYKLVKGLDVFDKVWANINRYVLKGASTEIKYIFLPENSNHSDVQGFIRHVIDINDKNCVRIVISLDMRRKAELAEDQIHLMAKMYTIAKQNDISVIFCNTCTPDEIVRICEAAKFLTEKELNE